MIRMPQEAGQSEIQILQSVCLDLVTHFPQISALSVESSSRGCQHGRTTQASLLQGERPNGNYPVAPGCSWSGGKPGVDSCLGVSELSNTAKAYRVLCLILRQKAT